MSLEKAIKYGKEHRKPYRGSKAFSMNCRSNSCGYCLGNDLYNTNKKIARAKEMQKSSSQEIP